MSEEVKTKTGATHRPSDEAFKRAAVAQWQSGVPAHVCGRHRVARLMQRERLAGRVRGRRRPFTTDIDHEQPIAPTISGSGGGRWNDPKKYRLRTSRMYSPARVGCTWLACSIWAAAASWLRMALRQRRPKEGLLHHSDRGCQYASEAYRKHLAAWKVSPSMSRRGNCYDNAAMESFWSTLKEELVHRRSFASRAEAADAIFDYVETFYNRERPHSALGFMSPAEFEKQINLN